MKHIYLPAIFFAIASCSTAVRYIGTSLEPTSNVDVYVTESSIGRPYQVIGKGFLNYKVFPNPEKIQDKAIAKAKEKGADAILIIDYLTFNTMGIINTRSRLDSTGSSLHGSSATSIKGSSSEEFEIFFIRYK